MAKIDVDFIVSDDGVLVLGFADELPPPPEVIEWHFEPVVHSRGLCLVPLVAPARTIMPRVALFNVSTRRIGGLRFIKVGRFCLSFCITRDYRSL